LDKAHETKQEATEMMRPRMMWRSQVVAVADRMDADRRAVQRMQLVRALSVWVGPQCYGLRSTLTAPSCFFWKAS